MNDDATLLWTRLGRWQEYRGEARANVVRVVAIAVFYAIELATYRGFHLGPIAIEATRDLSHHNAMTALAVAWTTLALMIHLSLWRRYFPHALPFFSTGMDLFLLTLLLVLANGPRSPAVVVYFLILALATLRFRLTLVWCATAGALASYLVVLWYARYWAPSPERLLPRYAQLIFAATLILCGVIQGQLIRQVRGLARDFAARLVEQATEPATTTEGTTP
jgi:hypothetical protein